MTTMHTHDVADRAATGDASPTRPPDWWHRDHPTFMALTGFFAGIAFLSLVPPAYVALMRWLASDETAEALFPFVTVLVAVPLGLIITERTRRFGTYMLVGMIVCAVVVTAVASVVIYVLSRGEL